MKKLIIISVFLLFTGSILADNTNVGSSGAQFLKIGVGSKYQGMAEASVAVANDVYAMYWNPAGLTSIENSSISFTNVNWFLDVDLNYFGFAHYFEDVGVFGVSAMVLSMGNQEITTFEQQEGTGQFYSASSYAIGVSFARQLTNRFSFGTTIKYVGERIHNERASSFAFDFGTLLHIGYQSLRLGMSISNMGPDLKFTGSDLDVPYQDVNNDGSIGAELKTTPYSMPMVFRMGMAYDFDFGPSNILTLAGELKHPNDNLQQASLGAEFNFNDKFFLRSGYKFNYEEETLAFGGGLNTKISESTSLEIDYAWQDFGRLSSTQRFSVGFKF